MEDGKEQGGAYAICVYMEMEGATFIKKRKTRGMRVRRPIRRQSDASSSLLLSSLLPAAAFAL